MRRRSLFRLPLAILPPLGLLAPAARAQPRASMPAIPTTGQQAAGRQAVALANAGRWPEAMAVAEGADPLICKLVAWMRLQSRGSGATAAEILAFALANPDWPGQIALTRRAEEALATEPDDALALEWFAARAPRSLEGYQRLADALARAGRDANAATVLRTGWAEAPADAIAEPGFLERNQALLTPEAHWHRFDRLAFARENAAAGRVLGFLDPARQGIAAARLDYASDRADADTPARAAAAPGDPGLTLERARWLRRREQDAEAAAAWAALRAPLPPEAIRRIWAERQILSRKLLHLGDARTAYALAAGHGIAEPGEPRQEAEFLAGFIALRRLEDPAAAERHFLRLAEGSRSVITRARSLYWQGRAAAAQGAEARARERFAAAAAFPLAFYGQLAALALGEDGAALSARIARTPPPETSAAEARALANTELARMVPALDAIGEGRRARQFLLRLEELAEGPEEKALVARLAARSSRPDHAVWVVRRAGAAGLMLLQEGWPTPYGQSPLGAAAQPEPALIHAVTRQESNFDPEAVSSSNARGLMQLLPATAQSVAKRLGLRHQTAMLTSDPGHNMRLGAGYLEQMLARFSDALPLAVAAYNAGPGRVEEWLGTYGDPRDGSIAMLDWMEMIPFGETRNYVQRVIENMAIYRARDAEAAGREHPMTRWLRPLPG
ncbi:lytic transglycosylase domain-containing protein [Siccirubricoccus sp. G192]|uniref:lytic transglycosylase domain-containing protein n=1 Tax=Siccirubricoccus sp. G192 TaxID=2849651 RepID=UPI001C2C539D|nr:lytic transglycosylase domain-containing protein [Siccirubricoccus sp. G192]MBV1798230.1 lytic transglycosylase domain-containing protein [Siccirubricoccus sp. G192]